eukprot:TRINITY_DN64805_c0_g1_i1.p1 TRINITY_DN64805_c0_g1~~TRINITY_DN64805_c0_g1_i1.p1  ORF type:complete len:239 (+),score=54.29 TRINITY_DN64805_c0_g1_i1:93-809(+)
MAMLRLPEGRGAAGAGIARRQRSGALSVQRRHFWWDRFVRNANYGKGLMSFDARGRPQRSVPGWSHNSQMKRHFMDQFFGYAPDYYAMEDRRMFDRRTLEPDRIRPPCDEIPDVETFLERVSPVADFTEYADKFADWDDLMGAPFLDMIYRRDIPVQSAREILRVRELYNNGIVPHLRWQGDMRKWAKERGNYPPFPENYYPHMRIAKYREKLQEAQTTGAKLADWQKMRVAGGYRNV